MYRGKLIRPFPRIEIDISGVGIGQIVSSVSISRTVDPGFYHDQHDGVGTFNQQTAQPEPPLPSTGQTLDSRHHSALGEITK